MPSLYRSQSPPCQMIGAGLSGRGTYSCSFSRRGEGESEGTQAVFELVRLHRIFGTYGTREGAVRAFASHRRALLKNWPRCQRIDGSSTR
jgi:hypothetical protein